jgi:8-amino-7-oxononanoate synthase
VTRPGDRTARWRARLDELRAQDLWRRVRTLEPRSATRAVLDGREVVVACSNDYLGLAAEPALRAAASGGGSTGSRLISGARPIHRELEDALEAWLGRRVLLFNSGWNANVGLLSTVAEAGLRFGSDALVHASIIDGLRLGRAERTILPHARPDAVPADLDAVVVESLYSMDGDVPDLAAYPRAPWLFVDEAHAIGALGPGGRGVAAAQGVEPDALVGTFGKAFGAFGAFVAGSDELIALLTNRARSFVFTTALPEPVAAMALAGLRLADDERRARLAANTARLRGALRDLGWEPLGDAHIVPIVAGPRAGVLAEQLVARGVFAPVIRWPTVERGRERLRFTVSAAHTADDLDTVAEALGPAPSSQGSAA